LRQVAGDVGKWFRRLTAVDAGILYEDSYLQVSRNSRAAFAQSVRAKSEALLFTSAASPATLWTFGLVGTA